MMVIATTVTPATSHNIQSESGDIRRPASPKPVPRTNVRSRSDFLSASKMVDMPLTQRGRVGLGEQRRRRLVVSREQDQGHLADHAVFFNLMLALELLHLRFKRGVEHIGAHSLGRQTGARK